MAYPQSALAMSPGQNLVKTIASEDMFFELVDCLEHPGHYGEAQCGYHMLYLMPEEGPLKLLGFFG